ncbi:MAG: hypothetical protein IJN43_09905 [Ruminococcus sp.]|nr:hypothetical protein [Ruminococcus sp.]
MNRNIINLVYRFIQLFIVIFISDRLEMNFWAKFGILVVVLLIFDEAEPYMERFFKGEPMIPDKDLSDNQGE